jgi:DNA (cytosine-5)-methyltransferase 1
VKRTALALPRLLDLGCKQGGASWGYHLAGFEVVGVDIEPQPLYPFEFHQGDMLTWPLDGFDVIAASPPCEFATQMNASHRNKGGTITDTRVNLLTPMLTRLRTSGRPYVVENVVGAGRYMQATLQLHGGMFGLGVHRPRLFECSELILAPPAPMTKRPVGVYGTRPARGNWTRQNGNMNGNRSEFRVAHSIDEARELMGMPWADWDGCRKAVPPAYTEYIGRQLIDVLEVAA